MNIHRKFALIATVVMSFVVAITSFSVGAILNSAKPANAAAGEFEIWDGTTASGFAGGTGAEDNPWQISNGAELKFLSDLATAGGSNRFFKLTKDIYLNAPETPTQNVWASIGSSHDNLNKTFGGKFDGNGFAVYGLYCLNDDYGNDTYGRENQYGGLFGTLGQNAEIKNLGVQGRIYGYFSYSGGIAGAYFSAGIEIKNCWTNVSIICTSPYGIVGGIVGGALWSAVWNNSIECCISNCRLQAIEQSNIGSIIGNDRGASVIINCVAANGDGYPFTGEWCTGVDIQNCSNFDENGTLAPPLVVDENSYGNVYDAMNAWVEKQPENKYFFWEEIDGKPAFTSIPPIHYFTVEFYSLGVELVGLKEEIADGDKINMPATPPTNPDNTKQFAGWYIDEEFTELYNFQLPVTQNLQLYAKWELIPENPTQPNIPPNSQTPTDTNDTTDQADKNNTPMIIGAIIALIALIIGGGISTYIILNRKKDK
jgi:uncharacterized repeat protein (TIGR02543 family)